MNDKELFDCSAKLAELPFNSFNARRERQWKVTLGLRGLILLATKFVVAGHPAKKIHRYFRKKGAQIILGAAHDSVILPKPWKFRQTWGFLLDGSSQFQVGTTVLLSIICTIVIPNAKPNCIGT
jgi:hypothetical protein